MRCIGKLEYPMASEPPLLLNLDDLDTKRRLLSKIGTLKGLWEVRLNPRRQKRSLNANSYYWAAYIPGWLEWLREASGEPWITKEQAHEELKRRVLGTKEVIDKDTGEVLATMVPETHTMEKWEFNEYLDRAAEFLASFCGIVVLSSDLYFETPEREKGIPK